jgi:dipeptidyl aminopeptidase/acylaminoacyl peptidase
MNSNTSVTPQGSPLNPSDLTRIRDIAGIAVHPTDGRVLYVESWFEQEQRQARLMAVHLDNSIHPVLPQHSVRSPVWSPDGQWLYFLSRQDGRDHLMGWDGHHAPVSLASFHGSVRSPQVSPDGTRRPTWLMRPLKPARETFALPGSARP